MPERSQDTDESRRLIREPALFTMTSNAAWSERRQTIRTPLSSVVYINFDSDNGGIVLNVSEGGLCFHSVAPVQREGALRFWFSEHKQRIEADGEIAWIDETRKTGGLRFTALPAEGHEQIRNWISRPAARLAVERPPAPSVAPLGPSVPSPARSVPSPSTAFTAIPPDIDMALDPLFPAVHLSGEADSPDLPAEDSPEIKVASLTGFSRGLATGLLVSALVALPLLLYSNRHELGESLIRLGERLAARSGSQTRTVTLAQQTVSPRLQSSSPTPKQIPVSPPERVPSSSTANPAKSQQAKIEQPARIVATHPVTGGLPARLPVPLRRFHQVHLHQAHQGLRKILRRRVPPLPPRPMSFQIKSARFRRTTRRIAPASTLKPLEKRVPVRALPGTSKSANSKITCWLTRQRTRCGNSDFTHLWCRKAGFG